MKCVSDEYLFVPTYVDKFVRMLKKMLDKDVNLGPALTFFSSIRGRNKHLQKDNFLIYYSTIKFKFDVSLQNHFSKINLHSVFTFIVCL